MPNLEAEREELQRKLADVERQIAEDRNKPAPDLDSLEAYLCDRVSHHATIEVGGTLARELIAVVAECRRSRFATAEGANSRDHLACKVCGNTPDETGEIEHGRGCYVASEDGGGSSFVELTAPPQPVALDTNSRCNLIGRQIAEAVFDRAWHDQDGEPRMRFGLANKNKPAALCILTKVAAEILRPHLAAALDVEVTTSIPKD